VILKARSNQLRDEACLAGLTIAKELGA